MDALVTFLDATAREELGHLVLGGVVRQTARHDSIVVTSLRLAGGERT